MEMSIKAPAVQAAAAVGGFMAFLAEVGAEHDKEQQTKTRWALAYYAGKHSKATTGRKHQSAVVPPKAAKAPARPRRRSPGAVPKAGKRGTRKAVGRVAKGARRGA